MLQLWSRETNGTLGSSREKDCEQGAAERVLQVQQEGHISRDFRNKDNEENEDGTETSMLMVLSALMTVANSRKSGGI